MAGARDGQLRIRRGLDSPPWALQMFDDDLGLWLTLAQANVEEDLMLAGVPILRGPYVVDFTDIPTDGAVKTLWTPQVGDVLLRLFVDWHTITPFDHGTLWVGQDMDLTTDSPENVIATHFNIGATVRAVSALDNIISTVNTYTTDAAGVLINTTATVFHSTDPVRIALAFTSGSDPTAGHVELYSLVARAVAP